MATDPRDVTFTGIPLSSSCIPDRHWQIRD
jgi:hypothetical protein